jgi:hypothetical protein
MSDHDLGPLGPEARAAIEAEIRAPGAEPTTRVRLRDRLWTALALAPIVPLAPPVPVVPSAGAAVHSAAAAGASNSVLGVGGRLLSVLARHPGPLVATSLTVGGFGGAAIHSQLEQSAARQSAMASHEVRASRSPTLASEPELPTTALPSTASAVEAPRPAPSPARAPAVHAKPAAAIEPPAAPKPDLVAPDVQLAAETALLERARAALARGWADAALEAIDQHRNRFPEGQLQEEREALGVVALAHAGRSDDAHRQAQVFAKQFPSSLWLDQVESADPRQP